MHRLALTSSATSSNSTSTRPNSAMKPGLALCKCLSAGLNAKCHDRFINSPHGAPPGVEANVAFFEVDAEDGRHLMPFAIKDIKCVARVVRRLVNGLRSVADLAMICTANTGSRFQTRCSRHRAPQVQLSLALIRIFRPSLVFQDRVRHLLPPRARRRSRHARGSRANSARSATSAARCALSKPLRAALTKPRRALANR